MTEAFTDVEMAKIRARSDEIKKGLVKMDTTPRSWILEGHNVSECDNRSEQCKFFDTHGFVKVDQISDTKEVEALRNQMASLAEQWDPASGIDSFGTDTKENMSRGDYFLESSNKVHFFAETSAIVDGEKALKPEFQNDKMSALNKAGHAMHIIPGAFQDYTKSDKIRDLVLSLGWKNPVVPQSMYIFKQRKIGAVVTSHQDSTFLFTSPKQSCLGLWLALHDATLENGCLWVRPQSHWEATRRQFKRNPLHFGEGTIDARSNEAVGDLTTPKFVMEDIPGRDPISWEGAVPEGGYKQLFDAGFIPLECKAGDLLAFNGEVDHLSLPNFSDKPRHTFQLHLVEGEKAGVVWSPSNWLQYPPGQPFMSLLDDTPSTDQ